MKIKIMVLVVMLGTAAWRADAGFANGNEILSKCESESAEERNICIAYLIGIADATMSLVTWNYMSEVTCMPKGVAGTQLKRIFIKYANEYPQNMHASASDIALTAFINTFPCE